MNYKKHNEVIEALKADQEAEDDLRKEIDDIIHFLHHPQGQWEPEIWSEYDGHPRYTFDQMKPAINRTWAEMAANDYAATTQPVGDGASEDVSNIFDGLIRNIYNVSCFDDISTKAGKRMIGTAFGCWRLLAKYIDDSFYQDIVIEGIPDCHRRVWFQAGSELQTRADANHVHILSKITEDAAKARWPKRDNFESVDDMRSSSSYSYKPKDMVTVGEILYKEPYKKTLYLLDDENHTVTDDEGLARKGLTAEAAISTREATCYKVYSRKYDGKDWLDEAKLTVFDYLPVVPEYPNFDINEGKVTYEGLVRNRMDGQRVFNYVESRKVEESILAPRGKIWMDDRVAVGYTDELSDLNRSPNAVQLYNGAAADKVQTGMPVVHQTPGPQPNPALSELSNDMIRNMDLSIGSPNEIDQMRAASTDSNFRFDQRSSIGQIGTFEYYRAHKVALEHTAKIILRAIPRVYDTDRKIRTVDEAGQSSEVRVNYKDAMGTVMNDLTAGKYDITVKIGKSFESRKAEANDGIFKIGQIAPEVVMRNTDVIAANMDAPGMRQVSDRERAILFQQGVIPESQWTDEERQIKEQQAQQPQQPDPAAMIAQAEMDKARFQALEAQAKLELQQNDQSAKQNIEAIKLELMKQKQDYDNLLKAVQAEKLSIEMNQPINQSVVNKAESEI